MGKVSTDEAVQDSSHFLSVFSTFGTAAFWRPNSYSTKKFEVSTAELFVLMVSTDLSHSA